MFCYAHCTLGVWWQAICCGTVINPDHKDTEINHRFVNGVRFHESCRLFAEWGSVASVGACYRIKSLLELPPLQVFATEHVHKRKQTRREHVQFHDD